MNHLRLSVYLILGILLFSQVASARDFDFESDRLCFQNADPEMARAAPYPWGEFAVKTGACQGIAGLSAAFFENAEYLPQEKAPTSRADARGLIRRLIHAHQRGWGKTPEKIQIPGYANLRSFCEDFRSEFMRSSVLYNRSIATHEILKKLPEFLETKGKISTPSEQLSLQKTLEGFEKRLARGEVPLLLYYHHVVLVYGLKHRGTETVLTVYDSNRSKSREMVFTPEGPFQVWDVTPHRGR